MAAQVEAHLPQTVLILSPLKAFSGNLFTAERIRKYFRKKKVLGFVKDPQDFPSLDVFHSFIELYQIACIFALHAFHCARLLEDCPVPYAVIFGGTDINNASTVAENYMMMTDVILNSKFVIAFTEGMVKQAMQLWPDDIPPEKIIATPPGVMINPSSSFSLTSHLRHVLSYPHKNPDVYLLVAGIRAVKEPLYVTKAFSDWHLSQKHNACLVIVGPPLEDFYIREFLDYIKDLPGVAYIPGLPQSELHAAIRDAQALINSSSSEGLSLAILEAMELETPVIARNVQGNTSIITNFETGLIYDSPQDFVVKLNELHTTPGLRERLVINAKRLITDRYNCELEQEAYLKHLKRLMPNVHYSF